MDSEPARLTLQQFQALLRHLDELVGNFETLPYPVVQEKVFDLLQSIDALHREGLSRLLYILRQEGGDAWLERATEDPVVQTLLALYDLLPAGDELLAELAAQADTPASGGPPANNSRQPANGAQPPASARKPLISLNDIQLLHPAGRERTGPSFTVVARLDELPPGAMYPVALDEARLLLINVGGDIFAVDERCPGSEMSLSFGALEENVLICPWHQEHFDVRSGRCIDPAGRDDGPRLRVYPIRVVDGEVQLANSPVGQRTGGEGETG